VSIRGTSSSRAMYKLENIGQAFDDNLGMKSGYIKGVVMPFMS
jgi:hypothetical protein